jgi:hypothetical protein
MIRIAFALVALFVASQAMAGERIKIVNDRRQVVGYIYQPCPTCRTQITDERRRIRGYIEPDGDIVDTRRRKILDLELEQD